MRFCVIYIYLFIFTIQRRDYYFFFFLINYNVREWFSTVGVINNEQKKFTYEKKNTNTRSIYIKNTPMFILLCIMLQCIL